MPEPHTRLDKAMNERRLQHRMNWREVAQAAGISYEALRAIRRGDYRPAELTARALDETLRWMPGSVYAVLDGGEPTTVEASTDEETPRPTEALAPSEALRLMVRASARELGMTPDDVEQTMRLVRQDLEGPQSPEAATEPPPSENLPSNPGTGRTDLSDLVRERRLAAGLSQKDVAARAVNPADGEHVVEADWLDRLERAALDPEEYPEYPQLDALADALNLDPGEAQEASGAQFMDVHTMWSDDGKVRGIFLGELTDPEDLAKAQELMKLYRRAGRRDG